MIQNPYTSSKPAEEVAQELLEQGIYGELRDALAAVKRARSGKSRLGRTAVFPNGQITKVA